MVTLKSHLQRQEVLFIVRKNDMFFKCHNCGMGQSLGNLIKFLDPTMYKEYIFERFKDGKTEINQSLILNHLKFSKLEIDMIKHLMN